MTRSLHAVLALLLVAAVAIPAAAQPPASFAVCSVT